MPFLLPEIDPAAFYTVEEAAALLPSKQGGRTVHPNTVKRWVREGRIQVTPIGGAVFVRGDELERALKGGLARD
jgi:hypothetical protein